MLTLTYIPRHNSLSLVFACTCNVFLRYDRIGGQPTTCTLSYNYHMFKKLITHKIETQKLINFFLDWQGKRSVTYLAGGALSLSSSFPALDAQELLLDSWEISDEARLLFLGLTLGLSLPGNPNRSSVALKWSLSKLNNLSIATLTNSLKLFFFFLIFCYGLWCIYFNFVYSIKFWMRLETVNWWERCDACTESFIGDDQWQWGTLSRSLSLTVHKFHPHKNQPHTPSHSRVPTKLEFASRPTARGQIARGGSRTFMGQNRYGCLSYEEHRVVWCCWWRRQRRDRHGRRYSQLWARNGWLRSNLCVVDFAGKSRALDWRG